MKKHDDDRVMVYSSESGRIRPEPKQRTKGGEERTSDGHVRLRRETKGRGGGTVVVISGVPLEGAPLKELAGALKKRCGCGGTVREGVIEIQGDHRETLLQELQNRGYRVKLAGG